jgi:sugar phosphate isomerase/epimerase
LKQLEQISSMQTASNYSRRHFLETTTRAALAAGLVGPQIASLAAADPPHWTIACRDGHLRATGQPDCWAAAKALELEGLEVTVTDALGCPGLYHPAAKYNLATADSLKQLQDDLSANHLVLTAFAMGNRFEERLEQELAWARKLVEAAQKLTVNAIRIDVVPRTLPVEKFLPFAIRACKQLCEIAAGTPVRFGIENHGHVTNDPAFLEKLFDGVGSPQLGLTLDAMNYYWFGHPLRDLYGICEKFAGRVFHTHCKNLRYPEDKKNARRPVGWEYEKYAAPLYEGDLDYKRIAAILRKADYRGDLCLENECLGHFPKEQHTQVLKKEIALLRSVAQS